MMSSTRCSCGFTELADETLADHLLHVFTPADNRDIGGVEHYESEVGTCSCGFTGPLDAHFLTEFTPASAIGTDDRKHEPVETAG
jgi:hypothetical protein